MVDVSASFDFGSKSKSKREMAAELASALAMSAKRNNDKVGLVLFSDEIERYIPPKKGRGHVMRVVREVLAAEPSHRGTSIAHALRFATTLTKQRAVIFLISDFESAASTLGEIDGLLEDSEDGRARQLDTGNRKTRERYAQLAESRRADTAHASARGCRCIDIDR